MRDIFDFIDAWDSRLNIFRDHAYLQKIVLVFCSIMVGFWVVLGWDSGVGMIGLGKINWSAYGKTFHFSAFVIYGLLFYGMSKNLERIGIKQSRNVFYCTFLTLFNIAVFEHFYGLAFAYFQKYENRLFSLYVRDFFFWQQYLMMLVLGAFTILALYVDSYKENKRLFTFQPDAKMFLIIWSCGVCALLWIFYPFPVTQAIKGNWVSSKYFPQTRYSMTVYIRNDLLHLVNVLTKAMFALTQFYIIGRFKK